MQVLCVIRRLTEKFGDEQFAPLLEPEAECVRSLYIEGTIRSVWSRGDKVGAVIAFEVDSEERAREIVATLPLMRAGMLELEMVIPLRGYRGFGPRA